MWPMTGMKVGFQSPDSFCFKLLYCIALRVINWIQERLYWNIDNERLSYADFCCNCSSNDNLHKVVASFFTPTEISAAKYILVSTFVTRLTYWLSIKSWKQKTKTVHDAKVKEIIGIFATWIVELICWELNLLHLLITAACQSTGLKNWTIAIQQTNNLTWAVKLKVYQADHSCMRKWEMCSH